MKKLYEKFIEIKYLIHFHFHLNKIFNSYSFSFSFKLLDDLMLVSVYDTKTERKTLYLELCLYFNVKRNFNHYQIYLSR